MGEPASLTIEILTQIRDEIRTTRVDLGARLDAMRGDLSARLDQTNARLDHVHEALLDLAEQHRL